MPTRRFGVLRSAAILALAACASARTTSPSFQMGAAGGIARARADSLRYPYTQADIDFMSGMIHHHAQAITISRWAPSHGAGAAVQRLTARIVNAQTDEISLMRQWLQDRNQSPPTVDSTGAITMATGAHDMSGMPGMTMPGMATSGAAMATMPGMLTDAQMQKLDAARGTAFDALFLTYMIQHHRGAVQMVRTLFASRGAGQDETIFKFAADVEVDQSTEIRRMTQMLIELGESPPPF